jgi:fido (protein-threonine AMPylation protein)
LLDMMSRIKHNFVIMRQTQILNLLLQKKSITAQEFSENMNLGLRTVQRELVVLINLNLIKNLEPNSKNSSYAITSLGRIDCILNFDLLSDDRLEKFESRYFDFELFETLLDTKIFDKQEMELLNKSAEVFKSKKKNTNDIIWQKEMQRLIVEFSWKSSKIEGNTYTLLETEELLNNKVYPDIKHSALENNMIINHKVALNYIFENQEYWKIVTPTKLLEIHKLLTNSLQIQNQFRSHGVGITASLYRPLDNQHQIKEAVEYLCQKLEGKDAFTQAIVISLLISYIQPFEDGNKRTSRTITNAILFGYDLPMISYRSTSVKDYKEAILSFYEFGSIVLFKKIFIEQIQYFAENYF